MDSPKRTTAELFLLLALDEAVESGARNCHLRRSPAGLEMLSQNKTWAARKNWVLNLACSGFLHVLTCLNMFKHSLTYSTMVSHMLTSRHVKCIHTHTHNLDFWVHHGTSDGSKRTSASNVCSFALPAANLCFRCPIPISDPLQTDGCHDESGWWFQPLWKKYSNQLGLLFPIYGKIKDVTNHHQLWTIVT